MMIFVNAISSLTETTVFRTCQNADCSYIGIGGKRLHTARNSRIIRFFMPIHEYIDGLKIVLLIDVDETWS